MQQLDELCAIRAWTGPDVAVTVKPWWILYDFPTLRSAEDFQRKYEDYLALEGRRRRVLIGVQGQHNLTPRPGNQPRRNGMTQPLILDPNGGLQLGRMKLGRSLLREMTYYLENPSVAGGFVELETEHQCMLSLACANFMQYTEGSLEDAVEWRREDYTYASDLIRIREEAKFWTPDDGEWHELTYLTFDPMRGAESAEGWNRFTNRYKLVIDSGRQYHVGENLEAVPVDRPF